ncbi:MAG: RlmE family RNA methyltransferase [Polyangiales bacterium]
MKPGRKPDPFTAKAQKQGFPARSVFKLEEIDRRCQLLRPGMRVMDLGAAPGSWSRYIAQRVGPKGHVFALDLNPLKVGSPQIEFEQLDLFEAPLDYLAAKGPFDLVVSDIAPHTTGVREADAASSELLVERCLDVADACLAPGGSFVAKIFVGAGFEAVRARMRGAFETVRVLKPEASRKESVEIFLVGLRRKAPAPTSGPTGAA